MPAPLIAAAITAATPLLKDLMENGLGLLAGAVANKGKEYVEGKFGVTLDHIDPAKAAELRQLEMDHEEELQRLAIEGRKLDLEAVKADYADIANARGMQETALKQDDVFSKRFLYYFAMAWCLFAGIYILAITFAPIPENSVRFADTTLGFLLGTVVSQIIAFFFGSSHRSAKKDETIAALTRGEK